jgi:glycopeptide antibiotics resistance protein
LLFIIYETTLPFQFEYSLEQLSRGWERAELIPFHWVVSGHIGRSDPVVNVVLFVPYGFFLALCPLFLRSRWWRPLLLVAIGFMTSTFIETWQLFAPTRWPQSSDVVTNTTGTLFGVCLASLLGREIFDQVCAWALHKLKYDSLSLIWAVLTGVILLGSLLPLDFGVNRPTLAQQMSTTLWNPIATPPEGWTLAGLGLIKRCWLFAFWGALAAWRLADRKGPLIHVVVWAALLAVVSEAEGLLIISRSVTSLSAIMVWVSASLAAAAALWCRQAGLSQRDMAIAAGLGYLIYLVADCLSPLAVRAVRVFLVPGVEPASFKQGMIPLLPPGPLPTLVALGDWLARLLRFVPLGLGLQLLVANSQVRRASYGLALLLVLVLELLVWRYTPWAGNLLEVVLAWLGIGLGSLAGLKIARYRRIARTSSAENQNTAQRN